MRRTRIKAMANVSVRRKQGNSSPFTAAKTESINAMENVDTDNNAAVIKQPQIKVKQEVANDYELMETDSICFFKHEIDKDPELCKISIENYDSKIPHDQTLSKVAEQKDIEEGSPLKAVQNRSCFMRPILKFDDDGWTRKNSLQGDEPTTSESEDDNRKVLPIPINHLLEDPSPSSAQNLKENSNALQNNSTKCKAAQKKRIIVSESAKKLMEARKEFFSKHENKIPDRSKLTMLDLIYYNPISTPMKKSEDTTLAQRKYSGLRHEELTSEVEENLDDPTTMPGPRVKVGSDGQLILDKQSLIIRPSHARKHKEVLSKEALLFDDDSGNGFYKKRLKSKEWSKWETLKFYKALNTVGTDFLLMQSLFPKRTRQEMKSKFKKEEKRNRKLIEKALEFHQEFDTDLLEKELAIFEESVVQMESRKRETAKSSNIKSRRSKKFRSKKISRLAASSIGEMNDTEDEDNCIRSKNRTFKAPLEKKQPSGATVSKRGQKFSESEEEKEINNLSSDSDSEDEQESCVNRPTSSEKLRKVKRTKRKESRGNEMDTNILPFELILC
ncbi:transcription factor TFIIIB component B'' homolog [Prorops nasuta]|uniref:transcription factor TFIIIB component B'' homolog n=1 Tax=Prorops nasuta TaxID=863751 RepID=UPI0034CD2320